MLLVALALAIVPATASAQDRLRVMTWNVQGGTAGDGREPDMLKFAQVLAETRPEVVGLQEGGEKFRCDYGTALFVRGRIDAVRKRELFPRDANGRPERRKVACAKSVVGSRGFWFCNTHVARKGDRGRDGEPITQRQIRSLARHMRPLEGPAVLVGDLNRKPQRDSPLARQFDEIDQHNRPTLGDEKIDYILYTPREFRRGGVEFLDAGSIGTDHQGMLGTLRFK